MYVRPLMTATHSPFRAYSPVSTWSEQPAQLGLNTVCIAYKPRQTPYPQELTLQRLRASEAPEWRQHQSFCAFWP